MEKLSESEVNRRLNQLAGWRVEDNCLKKEFKLANFKQAMQFINKIAEQAERLNHHPDWSNSYNKVSISLSTHSVNGLTEADFELAQFADRSFVLL
jgi:4a-hydroxytetrahydrobiopterin dehydratase